MLFIEELVFLQRKSPFTNSKIIADGTNNKHHAVRELIKKYKSDIEDFGTLLISNEESTGGRPSEVFLLTEEQATFVISLLRNSKVTVAFKKELVKQFYQMRTFLMQKQTQTWEETRKQGKLTRNSETSVLKELVQYAEEHGSKNAQMLYITYTKLANSTVGIKSRELATTEQLMTLEVVERIILNAVKEGISKGMEYHDIYIFTKEKVQIFQQVAYLA